MTVAFITEDESDSAILGAFLERLLARPVERVHYLARRGFGAVLKSAPPLASQAARARCEKIVVLVDCDETDDHYSAAEPHANCRLCRLRAELPDAAELARLSNGASTLLCALSVRTMETWLAVAGALQVPGSIHQFGSTPDERRKLKRIVYGEEKPPPARIQTRGVELISHADLVSLARTLPSFRAFADQIRG